MYTVECNAQCLTFVLKSEIRTTEHPFQQNSECDTSTYLLSCRVVDSDSLQAKFSYM